VRKVIEDGIRKFLDYVIELKEEQPQVFAEIMEDYEQGEIVLHLSNTLPQGKR
jgi:predicted SnoaL-like aldol condensation-catalyzing enzyme